MNRCHDTENDFNRNSPNFPIDLQLQLEEMPYSKIVIEIPMRFPTKSHLLL